MKSNILDLQKVQSIRSVDKYTESKVLNTFIATAMSHHAEIAIWRLPDSATINIIISFPDMYQFETTDINSDKPGFVINPFSNLSDQPEKVLPADIYYYSNGRDRHFEFPSYNISEDFNVCLCDFIHSLLGKLSHVDQIPPIHYAKLPADINSEKGDGKEQYIKCVEDCISAIGNKQFIKAVIARSLVYGLDEYNKLDIGEIFQFLVKSYPNAFVSFISTMKYGSWMGASPELLFRIDRNDIFHTVAMAGTRPVPSGPEDQFENQWNFKEIEEQAIVRRYIVKQFKKIGLKDFNESGSYTFKAGNVIHLKTDYMIDLKDVADIDIIKSQLLSALHPTPAICGTPMINSRKFIEETELLSRGLYAGYLGPVNINEETNLYVNIRCMQLLKNKIVLYAGAGVTADSVAENEWEESNHKCQTLLKIIEKFTTNAN